MLILLWYAQAGSIVVGTVATPTLYLRPQENVPDATSTLKLRETT
jgi:hypothetical protein